jgi:hypothetical protein
MKNLKKPTAASKTEKVFSKAFLPWGEGFFILGDYEENQASWPDGSYNP